MSDDVSASRTQRLFKAKAATDKSDQVDITPELKELFAQLVEATIAMGDATWKVREKPSPSLGQKLAELDLQIDAIIRRINQILG